MRNERCTRMRTRVKEPSLAAGPGASSRPTPVRLPLVAPCSADSWSGSKKRVNGSSCRGQRRHARISARAAAEPRTNDARTQRKRDQAAGRCVRGAAARGAANPKHVRCGRTSVASIVRMAAYVSSRVSMGSFFTAVSR
jgi:hypothetical protein